MEYYSAWVYYGNLLKLQISPAQKKLPQTKLNEKWNQLFIQIPGEKFWKTREIFYPWDQCFKYLLQLVHIYLRYCLKFIFNYKNWNTALVIFYLKKNMMLLKPHVKLRIRGRLHTETNKHLKTCKFHSWTNEFCNLLKMMIV